MLSPSRPDSPWTDGRKVGYPCAPHCTRGIDMDMRDLPPDEQYHALIAALTVIVILLVVLALVLVSKLPGG